MSDTEETMRRFRVHARDVDHHHARIVEEVSFEAAATAYLEHYALPVVGEDGPEIRVIVHDIGSGREHCFRIDMESGDTAPCG